MTPLEVLDPQALEQILEDTGGDAGFIVEILDDYVANTRSLLTVVVQSCESGEVSPARGAAHSIKGTSASLGARALSALAAETESMCRDEDLQGAATLIPQLRDPFRLVEEGLERERARFENDA